MIVEPVQGEGNVIPATKALQGLRGVRPASGVTDFDEVRASDVPANCIYAYGVTPDILTTAKALGGGFPIGDADHARLCQRHDAERMAPPTAVIPWRRQLPEKY